jgi:hypothetical protein
VQTFVGWYNGEHLHSAIHSAIRFVTPNARHAGHDRATLASRTILYANARAQNRNAGQAKPVTVNQPDPFGPTLNANPASMK